MIIDTLQDFNTTQEQKNEILNPYQEYLKKQSKLIEDKENQYYVECDESSVTVSEKAKNTKKRSREASRAETGETTVPSGGGSVAKQLENTL